MSDYNSLGSAVLNILIQNAEDVIRGVHASLMGSWPGATFVTLYVVIVGYIVLMGKVGERSKQWALSVFLLLTISASASNYDFFKEWVYTPIFEAARNSATTAAAGGEGDLGMVSGLLDQGEENLAKTMRAIDLIEVPGNFLVEAWLYIKVGIVIAALAILACAQYLAMVCLMSIAVFSLLMMFMVGGPCLWFASFKETRFITWAWLRATSNYSIWIFFIGAVSGVSNKFIAKAVDALSAWDLERDGIFTMDIGGHMLLTVLSTYMLLKTADWAAALTGGTSSNTGIIGGMGGMAGGVLSGAMGAAAGVAGGIGKWGAGAAINHTAPGQAMYRAYSAMKGIGTIK